MSDEIEPFDESRKLNCPKCSAAMETISFQDIKVDRCTSCKGLWFDALEKDHLDLLSGSESIDIGTAPAIPMPAHMDCPVCHTRMIDMVDIGNPQLGYKSCKVCYGLFFDAGEFREHKEQTTLSFFHKLFSSVMKILSDGAAGVEGSSCGVAEPYFAGRRPKVIEVPRFIDDRARSFDSGCAVAQDGGYKMFIHHVYFWLKPDAPVTTAAQLAADCRSLLSGIPGVKQLWAGPPAMTPREVVDNSYAIGLAVILEDSTAHDVYQDHPLHHEFIARNKANWERIRVFDFEA